VAEEELNEEPAPPSALELRPRPCGLGLGPLDKMGGHPKMDGEKKTPRKTNEFVP